MAGRTGKVLLQEQVFPWTDYTPGKEEGVPCHCCSSTTVQWTLLHGLEEEELESVEKKCL